MQKLSLITFLVLSNFAVSAQNTAIGIGTSTPNPSTVLHVYAKDQNKGIIFTETTGPSSIVSPKDGLLVYDKSVKQFATFKSNHWQYLNPWTTKSILNTEEVTHISSTRNVGIKTNPGSQTLSISGNTKSSNNISAKNISATNQASADKLVGWGTVPVGGIIMWKGGAIPANFKPCNGSNGTPNLVGEFVMASSANQDGPDDITYNSAGTNPQKLPYYNMIFIMRVN